MTNFPSKIAIIGVGLIGGSIALGLKKHFGSKITILGSCNSPRRAKLAVKLRIIDHYLARLESLPKDTGLVILASPISVNLNLLKTLQKISLSEATIIDVGSTKQSISELSIDLSITSFLGTHPMAGSEFTGFESANPHLFINKPWVICPSTHTRKDDFAIVQELVKILGARPILMNPKQHDQVSLWASHIPLILASMLINAANKDKNWEEVATIASSGFRDTTRLGSSDPQLKTDIIFTNKENIRKALKVLKIEIDTFSKLFDKGNKSIFNYFKNSKSIRDNWLTNYFG